MEALQPGTIVGIGWVIDIVLREGPTGVELRCHQGDAPDERARVKVFQGDDKARARFAREAKIHAELGHPRLLHARSLHLDLDPPCIVMDDVDAPTLRDALEENGALPTTQALSVARELAHLLAHLHARATYHRDLQPANILLTDDGPVVSQLGMVKQEGTGNLTMPGTAIGDVRYAPPEWVLPKVLKPQQWDLYGLGMTLQAMLTGIEPFPIPDALSPIEKAIHATNQKRAVPHLDPGESFPSGVRALVNALTASEPDARPTTARGVHHWLTQLIATDGRAPAPAGIMPGRAPPPEVEAAISDLPAPESQPITTEPITTESITNEPITTEPLAPPVVAPSAPVSGPPEAGVNRKRDAFTVFTGCAVLGVLGAGLALTAVGTAFLVSVLF